MPRKSESISVGRAFADAGRVAVEVHTDALDRWTRWFAPAGYGAAKPSTFRLDTGETSFTGAGIGDAPCTFGHTRSGTGRIGDLASGAGLDRGARCRNERIALVHRVAEKCSARDNAVVGKRDLQGAQAMLGTGAAARPVPPAAELTTAARCADRASHAVGPLVAGRSIGRRSRAFAGRCDRISCWKRHTRCCAAVRRAPRPRLIIADARRTLARTIGRRRDFAAAVENGVAGRLTAVIVRVGGGTFIVPTACSRTREAPGQEAKQQKPTPHLHVYPFYEKRSALATRPNFAEAVLVCSGQSRRTAGPGSSPTSNMTIDTWPDSHSRFELGMCDLAGLEGHAPAERLLL
jgi:hypothetical protein